MRDLDYSAVASWDDEDNESLIPGWNEEQMIGLILAVSSSVFIGSSFIIKKRGLRLAGASGVRAGMGGFSYLREPTWWAGMITMIVGEAANFAAYAFAPAILVTPLGALSIIISAVLAHALLNERLNLFGMLGCVLCITGSCTIVLHAPPEREVHSVLEIWQLAMQPAFIGYTVFAVSVAVFLIWYVAPSHGTSNIFVYIAICSLAGSLSVMSCKALGIALKFTVRGDNQLVLVETWVCMGVVVACVMTQMNYLNKALDLFNTAIVSPVYYVMFTTLTILASVIMFRDIQDPVQIATEACGFVTIVAGTFLLHTTRDMDISMADLGRLTMARGNSSLDRADSASATGVLLASVGNGRDKDRDKSESTRERTHLLANHGVELEERGKGF
uniref:Probable magnesium transporter n=1 Tax=Chlamydomonas leiostraca TaxID=1034604 RepID=A0A7S0WPU4_9CHLO|mmetsp:Transcript_22639/g.57629  ORF Transcript_22639/g.57629 Transcript_22639/m.57629 type:complete len:388 (+) Transcript_22639:72-1235(+)